jgi:hypothetical protein
MGSPKSEVEQQCSATYAEYVGNLEYDDDEMDGGDELPPATFDMDLGDVLMSLVQVNGEFIVIFVFLVVFLICFCVDMDASTHPSMPALTTGTTLSNSNSSMGWNNANWGQVEPPNWPSPTSLLRENSVGGNTTIL